LKLNAAEHNGKVIVCVELGSNIKPEKYLPLAAKALKKEFKVVGISRAWETPPVGCIGCENYLNAALLIETIIPNAELRLRLREIEAQLDRVRTSDKFAPRTIDIDVLIYDNRVIETNLWKYSFLAVPVSELMPDFRHPETGELLIDVAEELMEVDIELREDVSLG
jgi:2-amino-4-hydroxy-6-hydroxymethyldihydropteridine diphosphokinase